MDYGRWKSILEVAYVINRIEEVTNQKIEFNVYSDEKDKEIIEKLKNNKNINYKGYIDSKNIKNIMQNSDILLHIESFNPINIEMIKYSISTKIPDSLASGRILLIYAPKEIACTKYIEENEVGIVANNQEKLQQEILRILDGKIDIEDILKKAQELVENRHRCDRTYEILNRIGEKNNSEDEGTTN